MKLFVAALNLLLVVAVYSGCGKTSTTDLGSTTPTGPTVGSAITISNKTTTSFTATWGAATDAATAAANLMYKLVYSTSNNLTTAATAQANGTLVMDWTANTLTANLASLTSSTPYYLAVLVKNTAGDISLENGWAVTLCSGKRMFLATAANGSFGGKAGADAACLAQKSDAGTYKAMLGDSTGVAGNGLPSINGRQACYGNCEAATLYVEDWVFTTNETVCTEDYSAKVGTTGASYPVLYVPVGSVLSASPVNLFTGFNIAWGNSTGTNCNNWTSTAGTYVGGSSAGIYTGQGSNYSFIASAFPNCSAAGSIVCVEQ